MWQHGSQTPHIKWKKSATKGRSPWELVGAREGHLGEEGGTGLEAGQRGAYLDHDLPWQIGFADVRMSRGKRERKSTRSPALRQSAECWANGGMSGLVFVPYLPGAVASDHKTMNEWIREWIKPIFIHHRAQSQGLCQMLSLILTCFILIISL